MTFVDILKAIGSFAPNGPGAPASPYRAELLREQQVLPAIGSLPRVIRSFIGLKDHHV